MGLYPIDCTQCKTPFLWFSGNLPDQRCGDCKDKDSTIESVAMKPNEADLVKTINETLTAFLGRPATETLAQSVHAALLIQIKHFYAKGVIGYIPKIEVLKYGNHLEIVFSHPDTDLRMTLDEWLPPESESNG